jgi:hypothetical protein
MSNRPARLWVNVRGTGSMAAYQAIRDREGRTALNIAQKLNEQEQPRRILKGPVGGPWWLFRTVGHKCPKNDDRGRA